MSKLNNKSNENFLSNSDYQDTSESGSNKEATKIQDEEETETKDKEESNPYLLACAEQIKSNQEHLNWLELLEALEDLVLNNLSLSKRIRAVVTTPSSVTSLTRGPRRKSPCILAQTVDLTNEGRGKTRASP